MSSIVFNEIVEGKEIVTSFMEQKAIGKQVVYNEKIYKITATSGIGKSFIVILKRNKKKIVLKGNDIGKVRTIIKTSI